MERRKNDRTGTVEPAAVKSGKSARQDWINRANQEFGDVETAAELTPEHVSSSLEEKRARLRAASEIRSAGRSVGWAALLFAAISWLVWPVLMGPAAAILGMIAYYQGSRTLGLISIAMGGLAAIVYLILLPLYVLLG